MRQCVVTAAALVRRPPVYTRLSISTLFAQIVGDVDYYDQAEIVKSEVTSAVG